MIKEDFASMKNTTFNPPLSLSLSIQRHKKRRERSICHVPGASHMSTQLSWHLHRVSGIRAILMMRKLRLIERILMEASDQKEVETA